MITLAELDPVLAVAQLQLIELKFEVAVGLLDLSHIGLYDNWGRCLAWEAHLGADPYHLKFGVTLGGNASLVAQRSEAEERTILGVARGHQVFP